MAYLLTTPRWLRLLQHAALVWEIPASLAKPTVYLTFDDGPHPEITPWVLQQLAAYKAKATFFCIGNNAVKYPEVFTALRTQGHMVGNHTMHHANGWKTPLGAYIAEVTAAQSLIPSTLFRPPYGRIRHVQAQALRQQFQLVMWSVLSGDFDMGITGSQCTQNVVRHLKPGSIVVFHDSEKAWPRLRYALPRVLEYCHQQNWHMEIISPSLLHQSSVNNHAPCSG